MHILRDLLDGKPVDFHGEFIKVTLDPPRLRPVRGGCPPFYFGGLSEAAREVAAQAADVFLMWPDTLAGVGTVLDDMRARAARYGRELRFGYRAHVIVRATEAEARAAAQRLVSRLDERTGNAIRRRSLDTHSAGTQRQNELRDTADDDGYAEPNLWTGIGRARSGAGAAIVGDPDQVLAKIRGYADLAWTRSSCPATRTPPKPTCSPGMCCPTLTMHRCSRAERRYAPPDRHYCAARAFRSRTATGTAARISAPVRANAAG
jgi:alkanesulfonate monooxygenase